MEQIDPPAEIISVSARMGQDNMKLFPIGVNSTEIEIVFGNPLDEDGLKT